MNNLTKLEAGGIIRSDSSYLAKVLYLTIIFTITVSPKAFSVVEEIYERDIPTIQGATVGPLEEDPFSGGLIGFTSDKDWRLLPGFESKTTYDSNTNRERQGKTDKRDEDIILHYTPSIALIRSGTRFSFRSIYQMSFQEFLRDAKQTGFNHNVSQSIQYVSPKIKTGITYAFSNTKAAASDAIAKRRTTVTNNFQPKFEYQFTRRFSAAALYEFYELAYKDIGSRDNSNYRRHNTGGRATYHFSPKMDFFIEGRDLIVKYYRNGFLDSKGFVLWGGSNVKVTEKFYLTFQPGYKMQIYKDSTLNTFNGWVFQGDLRYKFSNKMLIFLKATRDRQETSRANGGWNIGNNINGTVTYKVRPRISLVLDGSLGRTDYIRETTAVGKTKRKQDHTVVGGALIKWNPIRTLNFSVGYKLRFKNVNIDNEGDYRAHILESAMSYKLA